MAKVVNRKVKLNSGKVVNRYSVVENGKIVVTFSSINAAKNYKKKLNNVKAQVRSLQLNGDVRLRIK